MSFNKDVLSIDCEIEADRTYSFIQKQLTSMKRDGIVIGISGGIDSAVSAELCVRAIGKSKVLALILPEKESNPISAKYASIHADRLGVDTITVDVTPTLEGFGTYEKRDIVIKKIFPEYDSHYKSKITLPSDLLTRDAFNIFTLTIEDERGRVKSARLDTKSMRGIVAATDSKQRTRMMHLYYYAELNNYLVCGTTNKTEIILGFFVKYGDGGVDIEPLAHLYKTQVYQLANYLGVVKEIIERVPSPDTFSYIVSDEEFYFRIPYNVLDLLLYAWDNKVPLAEVSKVMDLTEEQIKRAFRDFTSKSRVTQHIHVLPPKLV